MDCIGGYLSLEFPQLKEYHKGAIRLNTGRNCLEYILRVRGYIKLYVPYFTCEAVMEPIIKLGISYELYHIDNNFEICDRLTLKDGEALLYTNYFGLKQRYVEELSEKVGSHLIIDNTQAFYAKHLTGIDTFYSCRKFFGVPDGAYLYCDKELDDEFEPDYSYDRLAHLVKRIDLSAEDGFADFRQVENGLDNQPIRKMSKLTQRLMQGIDYGAAAQQRRANFHILHEALGKENNIKLPLEDDAVPMVYPYFVPENGLRERLIENKIFVARYWPNVQSKDGFETEYNMSVNVIPIPCDQRYDEYSMWHVVGIINQY